MGKQPVSKPVRNYIYAKDSKGQRIDDLPTLDIPEDELLPDIIPEGALKPNDLIGPSFLLDPDEDGQRLQANIVKKVITFDDETESKIKAHFVCEVAV